MSDSETKGRCRSELNAAYQASRFKPNDSDVVIVDAIDRLAADLASIKAKIDAVSPEDVRHFVDSEKAWVAMIENQRDSAIGERNKLRAEVERLNAELAARQPAGNSPEIPHSSPAAPQPAAPAAGWLTEEEREMLQSRSHAIRAYLRALCNPYPGSIVREVEIIDALLSRAGSPPVVEVPPMQSWEYTAHEEALAYRAALDKAGVAWKEVGRE